MSPTLNIYTHITQITEEDENYDIDDISYFNKFKYENLWIEGNLIKWIITECKTIKIKNKYGYEYYLLDDLEKLDKLKDLIWNRQIDNYIFNNMISALDFAYDCYDFIKNGGKIYFDV
jgi:hypothetical protein